MFPVAVLGQQTERLTPALLGFTAGVMGVASFVGLLIPASHQGSAWLLVAGLLAGVAFLACAQRRIPSDVTFFGARGPDARSSALVFLVLAVHSLPEGLAVGAAYASNEAGLSLFVILAIAIQNIPEGTAVAVPMQHGGFSLWRQFWAAVGTSAPQPVGALLAYLAVEQAQALLPVSLAFAAGAMLALVAADVLPDAYRGGRAASATAGVLLGSGVMFGLSVLLGV